MATFQELIVSVRQLVQDVDEVRWSDADLLEYANEAVREIRRLRPDLFLGTYTQTIPSYVGTDAAPIPPELEASMKDYVVYRANVREDDYAVDGRAAAFLGRFRQQVMTT